MAAGVGETDRMGRRRRTSGTESSQGTICGKDGRPHGHPEAAQEDSTGCDAGCLRIYCRRTAPGAARGDGAEVPGGGGACPGKGIRSGLSDRAGAVRQVCGASWRREDLAERILRASGRGAGGGEGGRDPAEYGPGRHRRCGAHQDQKHPGSLFRGGKRCPPSGKYSGGRAIVGAGQRAVPPGGDQPVPGPEGEDLYPEILFIHEPDKAFGAAFHFLVKSVRRGEDHAPGIPGSGYQEALPGAAPG